MRVFENISRGRAISLFLLVYLIVALYPSLRNLSLPLKGDLVQGFSYTEYNNFIIFKQSFWHLMRGLDLYAAYPAEHYDLYKYTPVFALLFAPFALVPTGLGLIAWNILNVLLPLWALSRIFPAKGTVLMALSILVIPEVLTSAFNSQSNGLVVGLLLVALGDIQREKWTSAAVFITLSALIKLFGVLFFALFLLRPDAWKNWLWRAMLVVLLLVGLPLLLGLSGQYASYLDLLQRDHSSELKHSIFAWIQAWFGGFETPTHRTWGLFAGLIIQAIPLLFKRVQARIIPYAASWLMFMVLFNHMAESASFIIAVMGVVLYLVDVAREKAWHWSGLISAFIVLLVLGTLLGPTDLYPSELREFIVFKAQLKTFPVVLFWLSAWWDSIKKGPHSEAFSQG
jgi:hypothetical protein